MFLPFSLPFCYIALVVLLIVLLAVDSLVSCSSIIFELLSVILLVSTEVVRPLFVSNTVLLVCLRLVLFLYYRDRC